MLHILNLEQAIFILSYLKAHPNRKLGLDPTDPTIKEHRFQDLNGWRRSNLDGKGKKVNDCFWCS